MKERTQKFIFDQHFGECNERKDKKGKRDKRKDKRCKKDKKDRACCPHTHDREIIGVTGEAIPCGKSHIHYVYSDDNCHMNHHDDCHKVRRPSW